MLIVNETRTTHDYSCRQIPNFSLQFITLDFQYAIMGYSHDVHDVSLHIHACICAHTLTTTF